jgi:hypothetical protein
VFLRQPLFTIAGHVPRGAVVVEGIVQETTGFGLTLHIESYMDESGKPLAGEGVTVMLPSAKIDHVLVVG